MSSGEILYSARTQFPDSIVDGRDNTLALEVRRDGGIVTPDAAGTFTLLNDAGDVVVTKPATIAVSGRLEAVVLATDMSTFGATVGELYQTRWTPTMPGESDARTFRREAVITPLRLYPPVSEVDIEGLYPDISDQLGQFASNLQTWLDQAWGYVLRRLLKNGRWPDLLVSTHDAFDVVMERTIWTVYRFLFSKATGSNRFETLMKDHEQAWKGEWATFSGRWDEDADGLAEDLDREAANLSVHINAAPRRRLRRDSRW